MATAFADVEPNEKAQAQSENTVADTAAEQPASETKSSAAAPSAAVSKVQEVVTKFGKGLIAPALGILAFLAIWAALAPQVDTSLGALPGPLEVAEQGVALYDEWQASNEAKAEFYAAQDARIQAGTQAVAFDYAGPPTFLDQVLTSLKTVALGFILATVFAVPVGLAAGLSPMFNAAINPLVQIMKPVSPLAWLPIVTMVVSATITSADPLLAKSFVISAIVVMLCSLWPTLINTAIGTASIDKDLLNVGRVLKLGWFAKLTRLVLPSSLPYIFTGMRLSLGVGWMVLIAAEMLAQNPGLGKFVWDEFQNGSSQSLARIMFAVIVIGLIGFLLDRIMMTLQSFVSRNRTI
jgi:nitrate/nitrite transport system permease protein